MLLSHTQIITSKVNQKLIKKAERSAAVRESKCEERSDECAQEYKAKLYLDLIIGFLSILRVLKVSLFPGLRQPKQSVYLTRIYPSL
jgi:hypothetical protein